ncbi:hypothetical protein J7F03_10125 [Streptomyces sp. ISL-43]|uniref:hypothetical protein n=1 Tax=Streptomyces sp. ISL-43 TaxID=2819183 RepID=UPI001BE5BB17|nr:hypothetical protein [Streptomyces sp. ISL-43]MBT2447425.1 hypothetical protein [Streptomyces sp. ISL-43]
MSILMDKINAVEIQASGDAYAPVMATPAAFVAGAVAGAKVSGALVAAAGVGAAVASAKK